MCGIDKGDTIDSIAIALSMEYRSVANRYLSRMELRTPDTIELSPVAEVNKMLIADKVQNRKDFERYNRNHPREEHLALYFDKQGRLVIAWLGDNNYGVWLDTNGEIDDLNG